jgi:hypothetical protein
VGKRSHSAHNCLEDDPNDWAFIHATPTIGGRDAVEAEVLLSKIVVPLPKFVVAKPDDEGDEQFVMWIAARADKLVQRYGWNEHQTLLQKQFLVSAGNRSLVPTSESDTLCVIKNDRFLVLATVDRHLWCWLS